LGKSVVFHCASAKRLAELGLRQDSKRHFTPLTSFGLATSFCSVLVGIIPLYGQSIRNGGPVAMFWSWLFVGFFSLVTVCCLAEMASAFPTAGTLYYWSNRVAGTNGWGPFASWLTGWSIFLGQISSIGAATYSAAGEVGQIVTLLGGAAPSTSATLGIFFAFLVLSAVVNMFSETFLTGSSYLSIAVHLAGSAFIVFFLIGSAAQGGGLQSPSFVMTKFVNNSGFNDDSLGTHGAFYVCLIALLSPASTFTGYDTAASVSEETLDSSVSTPVAMIMAVVNATVLGAFIIVGLNMSIQDLPALLAAENSIDAFTTLATQNTSAAVTVGMHFILCTAMQCAANSTFTSASRFIYSFARDGALPFSSYWANIHAGCNSPVRAIWLAGSLTMLMALVGQGSNLLQIFFAVSTVTYFVSYLIPVMSRVTVGRRIDFTRGSFTLGAWGQPMCVVASVFCLFMAVSSSLTLTPGQINWAGPIEVALLGLAVASWHLSAKSWYLREKQRRLPNMDSVTTMQTDLSDDVSSQQTSEAADLGHIELGLTRYPSFPSVEDISVAFIKPPASLCELADGDEDGGDDVEAPATVPAACMPPPVSLLELDDDDEC